MIDPNLLTSTVRVRAVQEVNAAPNPLEQRAGVTSPRAQVTATGDRVQQIVYTCDLDMAPRLQDEVEISIRIRPALGRVVASADGVTPQ